MKTVLLLGSGYPDGQLLLRRKIGQALPRQQCKPIIMEYAKVKTFSSLISKFESLLNCKPDFIVVIFTRDGNHDAVYFELGYITKKLAKRLKNKLLILTDMKVDPLTISSYLRRGLYLDVVKLDFDQKRRPNQSNSANDMIQVFLDSKNRN